MIAADLLAIIVVLGLLGLGGKSLFSALHSGEKKRHHKEAEQEKMREDLRAALASKDYRKLDDFMVVWANVVDPDVMKHIKERRDELYIESNA